ncbi:helix-turn-helix transcriptional regulator, MerR family, PTSIIA domain-containing [Geotalea daltonii FRC-32]|uniref:Helix-turn-helix transcriptional regulator, MerR family, PTSIIA domain-containing n=1 Tax=Geotalea daltonii (strain DSM 22248 / JCM 15807 / FRC-32) TaxID=316067 RepID=B9M6K3_GEODF|nr:PTS sugar transporter subunit IIA [Geotalea daltonii]ACM20063.1 helix-turn-helix transcriptional regulator, MerR family, PTSIIA domain-containing [Geotalea daltonii FRC-32]
MLLTVSQAAKLLHVPEKTVLRWIKKDQISACTVNEEYRLNRVDLLELATEQRLNLSPEIFAEPEEPDIHLPHLSQVLKAGGTHHDIQGKTKDEVLKNIISLLKFPPQADRDYILQVLMAREALGTTAIGDGIAIPHVRNPILLHVNAAMITLCFLTNPIDFKAIDNKPVDTIFLLISPTVKVHLHLLSKLAYILRDQRFKAVLQRQGPQSEIIAAVKLIEGELAGGNAR